MVRSPLRVLTCVLFLIVAIPVLPGPGLLAGEPAPGMLVYHQITDVDHVSGSVGSPMLSGDGSTVVFSDAPGSGDPEVPNRIFTVRSDGEDLQEVDSFQPLCFCGAHLGISDSGDRVVSSDSVQIRTAAGGVAETLVTLTSNEITWVTLTGDGETIFFIVRRDAATADGATSLARGIWAIDFDGDNLRQVVGVEAIADLFGFPVEQSGCCFHGDGHPLAVSDDGGQVVFASYGTDGEYVLAADGDGGNLHELAGPGQNVFRVAISGDGETVAWDTLPLGAARNEVAVGSFGGGEATVVDTPPATEYRDLIQLSEDGSRLLVSPIGLLIDTASGEGRLLAVSIQGMGGNHEAVLTDGLPRAAMDAEGSRFVYVMHASRCADCVNLPEQVATLEIDPADAGAAPVILDATVDPREIGLAASSSATVTAAVNLVGDVSGVGAVALLNESEVDINLGGALAMLDDGAGEDVTAGDGVYSTAPIVHSPSVARDPDTGPRTIRVAAEYEDSDGLRHATAVDAGILTVSGG